MSNGLIISLSFALIAVYFVFFFYKKNKMLTEKLNTTEKNLSQANLLCHQHLSELQELKQEVFTNLTTDKLTGLPSRKVFDERLAQLIVQSERYNLLFALLFLDIDQFKTLQEAIGIDGGEELLKALAGRLKNHIRQLDAICRFNVDEFLILLAQISKPEMAALVAERLLKSVAEPFRIKQQEIFITASIGIALFPNDGKNITDLVNNADNALRQTKSAGTRIAFYYKEMNETSRRELNLRASLHNEMVVKEFKVLYQPEIYLKTQSINAIEARLYWQHAEYGLMPFQTVLQVAEATGNMMYFGEWLLKQASQDYQSWQQLSASLEVGVCQSQLENPHFVYQLSQILESAKLNPAQLILEIAEWSMFTKLSIIEKTFSLLKNLGVRFALTQVGSGPISLQHLQQLPLQRLKIASEVIQNIENNLQKQEMVKMILALAHSLKIQVIATGVQNQAQKTFLTQLGCEFLQGDFLMPPSQATEFAKYFNTSRSPVI